MKKLSGLIIGILLLTGCANTTIITPHPIDILNQTSECAGRLIVPSTVILFEQGSIIWNQ